MTPKTITLLVIVLFVTVAVIKLLMEEPKTIKSAYVGFMRLITFNLKLWGKPTALGWRKIKNETKK